MKLIGVSAEQWQFILHQQLEAKWCRDKNHLMVFPSFRECKEAYKIFKHHYRQGPVFLVKGIEHSPYGGIVTSEQDLYQRFKSLNQLAQLPEEKSGVLCFTTVRSLLFKNPTPDFFRKQNLQISLGDVISPYTLAKKLVQLGHHSGRTVETPGSFCQKGEIFDIHPLGDQAVRLHYCEDTIEEIFAIDRSLRTDRSRPLKQVLLTPTPAIVTSGDYSKNLYANLLKASPRQKMRLKKRNFVLSQIKEGQLFENYPPFMPLFFKELAGLVDFFPANNRPVIHFLENSKLIEESQKFWTDCQEEFKRTSEPNSDLILAAPEKIFFNLENITKNFPIISVDQVGYGADADSQRLKVIPVPEPLKFIKEELKEHGNIKFCYQQEATVEEFKYLLTVSELKDVLKDRLHFIRYPLNHSFYLPEEDLLILAAGNLFAEKKPKIKNPAPSNVDLFAEQLTSLKTGDFVVHSEYGIGEYLGLESMPTGGQPTDFLVVLYAENDKIYLPVYKINLIQKYADSTAKLKINNLRTNKFSQLKGKARKAAKKLAFDLLALQAQRKSARAFAFSPPSSEFNQFEREFPFNETRDQAQAIEEVLENMQKDQPMDHLVCGDVGFGKTEVAMRASFKAVLDGKQVAILAPTTILTVQHYNNFKRRFKNFAVNIEFLSRFKTTKEAAVICQKLSKGEIDIVIGTHKLLGSSVSFSDLGLVIVDEEHRFGVAHKEKLKLLKANIDFLTLTATPIPRTLRSAFLGLKEVSLIRTPPPGRQAIKTYILREDDLTLKRAMEKELGREGQILVVHNRIKDIEAYATYIKKLMPNARLGIGHGQLAERELEKRINAFYSGKYQILVTTTIIESGLDIPNANTMIVNNADTFGLAQLHQLRGRVGRSERDAYAYFVIGKDLLPNAKAEKRLKALQTYTELGEGFNLANADLEIRGAGDILGGEQSGHIEAIGLELYMELLNEAIAELKGQKKTLGKNIEISTPFPAYIPKNYIANSNERLRQYKRLSNCMELEQLVQFKQEFSDIFGRLPPEVQNLLQLLEIRITLRPAGIKLLSLVGSNLSLQFDQETLADDPELSGQVTNFFLKQPNLYQFSPNYKVLCKDKTSFPHMKGLLQFCQKMVQQIISAPIS